MIPLFLMPPFPILLGPIDKFRIFLYKKDKGVCEMTVYVITDVYFVGGIS